jgi:hypothetical protein
MRILGLCLVLASCAAVQETAPVPGTPDVDVEESGSSDEGPRIQTTAPVASATMPEPARATTLTDPVLRQAQVSHIAIDSIAKIRDKTGAVPPPYVIRSAWEKRRLTYCFVGWTADLTEEELIEAAAAAAWVWMEASNLVLTRVVDCWGAGADIRIDFLDEDHFAYDSVFGSSTTAIAEADVPYEDYALYLDLRDDDAIEWTTEYRTDGDSPFDVRTVLTHEFGHVLGLSHTEEACDGTFYPVMCPIYGRSIHTLSSDDVNGISASYGTSMGYCQDGLMVIYMGQTSMTQSMAAAESLYAEYWSYSAVSTLYTAVDATWDSTSKAYNYAQQTAISGPISSGAAAYHSYVAIGLAEIVVDAAYDAYISTGSADAITTEYRAEDAGATFEVAFDLMYQCYADEYGDDPDF